jgi:putative Mn2+ efflux pump MntP
MSTCCFFAENVGSGSHGLYGLHEAAFADEAKDGGPVGQAVDGGDRLILVYYFIQLLDFGAMQYRILQLNFFLNRGSTGLLGRCLMDLKKFLSWIPGWLGFLALIIVGTIMAIHGLFNPLKVEMSHEARTGFSIFGLMAVIIGVFDWIVGATSKIVGKEGKFGVKVSISDMPWWAWLVDIGVVGLAIVLYYVLK